MARVTDNAALLSEAFMPAPVEEPQIIFRHDAREKFDERYPYGHLDKAELLLRLNVQGPWDNWVRAQWGMPRPKPSLEAGKFAAAGWVARLFSGQAAQEVGQASTAIRIGTRAQALVDFIARLDECTDVAAANALPTKLLP